jgi:hypothetical protein
MAETDTSRVVRDIADLRMQVHALEVTARNETLPASVKEARSTLRWSAIVIAAALVVSSLLKYCGDGRVERLEKRVEALEKSHDGSANP